MAMVEGIDKLGQSLLSQSASKRKQLRDDVKKSTEGIEMIKHYAECSECGIRNCEKFETLSKNIILNDSFVIVYQYSHPCAFGWEMIGFSPYRINELNMTQLAEKHNDNLIQKKEVR